MDWGCEWGHARKRWAEDLGWFKKKKWLVEIRTWAKRVDFRASVRPGQLSLRDALSVVGSDRTVSIVKIASLSPRIENLKVKKVIKVSYLNKESRQCFAYFGIPMHVNVLRIRIFVYSYFEYVTIDLLLPRH